MTNVEIKTILKRGIIERMELLLEVNEFEDNVPLFGFDSNGNGIGLDSIDILEIIVILKKDFGIEVKANEEREVFKNLSSLVEFVGNKLVEKE